MALAIGYALVFAVRRAAWPIGDWLINYKGGFVRRALPGQVTFLCARALHVSPVLTVTCLQIFCIFCITAGLWPLVRSVFRARSPWWAKALLVSPATLAFVWQDPSIALRKEITFLALLAIVIRLLRHSPEVPGIWLAVFLAVTCPAAVLSHDAVAVYLPYIAAAVVLGSGSISRAVRICTLPAILSVLALGAAVLHTGNQQLVDKVCQSIGGPSTGMCAGPMGYLAFTPAMYKAEVASFLHDGRMLSIFALTGMLALIPALAGCIDLWRRPVSRSMRVVIPAALLLSGLGSVVLFRLAQDWSRWISLHVMCLLFLLLFEQEKRLQNAPSTADLSQQPGQARRNLFVVVALVLYATMWHLPEWNIEGTREYRPFGFAGFMTRLHRHTGAATAKPKPVGSAPNAGPS